MATPDWIEAIEQGDVLSIEEAASILHVSRATVWRLVRDGAVPAIRIGKKTVRIRKEALSTVVRPVARDGAPLREREAGPTRTDDSEKATSRRARLQAAERMLARREQIGLIPDSTTDLIEAGREGS